MGGGVRRICGACYATKEYKVNLKVCGKCGWRPDSKQKDLFHGGYIGNVRKGTVSDREGGKG